MSDTEQPFTAIWCQPSYGQKKTLVEWTLPVQYQNGQIYVYRSLTGTAPWECLNPSAPVSAGSNYQDDEFVVDNRIQPVHYRLMLEHDGKRYGSPAIHLLQELTKSQYGVARAMLIRELRGMRLSGKGGNGIRVFHYPVLSRLDEKTDVRTGQATDVPCPNEGLSGFASPVETWVKLGATRTTMQDRPDGDGVNIEVTTPARLLSYPKPMRGNVIVDPISDDRYAVDSVVDAFRFRGIVAIAYQVNLRLLARGDERYRLPVPSIL